jgi:primosomal protein N' (replication factor Y)
LARPGQKGQGAGDTFHYRVPQSLAGRIAQGHLVIVPFGRARVYGIVTALSDTSPLEQLKEIESLALPAPVVTPAQIALARWMRDEYLTTLPHCLFAMLPPGLVRPAQAVYRLKEIAGPLPADLTGTTRAVVNLLARQGPLRLTQLQYRLKLKRKTIRRALARLRRRGLVASESVLPPVGGGARQVRYVRLLADDEAMAAARPHLGHDSAQARVLRHLAATPDPLPTLEAVCNAADCSPGPVRALVEKGWVTLTPRQTTLVPALSPGELAKLAAQKESRAPRQAELLRYLAGHPGPVAWDAARRDTGASSSVARALEEAGLIRRVAQEPAVLLRLSPQEAESRALELRGGTAQAAALDTLRREGEPLWVSWLYAETGCALQDLYRLEELGLVELAGAETWPDASAGEAAPETAPPLTPDQSAAWAEIQSALRSDPPRADVTLLHGVTGSGKTELYLRALAETLAQGRQGVILVPEISLTPQTVGRFTARFPGRVAVYHSDLSMSERYEVWRRVRDGRVEVVVGPRSALFVPFPRLGLIVLDEEHSTSYKQPRTPHYHARDAAIALGRVAGAPVILGSATPDLVSYHRARQGRYRLLRLSKRILGHRPCPGPAAARYATLPPVTVVDLRDELRAGNRSVFSRALHSALAETLHRSRQAILFLNRRGAATFVNCRDCGHVLRCSRCDVPLTYHSSDGRLVCHHCGRRSSPPEVCPRCGGRHVRYFGIGTQRVEAAVRRHFPAARVLRWDRDTVGSRWGHERLLRAFVEGQADVLVGTQMVTKGLDLPQVTLVGVIAADTALHLPDFRAAERTFQLLTQVAGRAGRSPLGGRVVVQSYSPGSYAVQAAARHDYEAFYRQELAFRRQTGYPPFYRLARLVCAHTDPDRCQAQAREMHDTLKRQIARLGLADVALVGPAPCFITRVRGRYRWQIVVRAPRPQELLRHVGLPLGWKVNVDPVSLL